MGCLDEVGWDLAVARFVRQHGLCADCTRPLSGPESWRVGLCGRCIGRSLPERLRRHAGGMMKVATAPAYVPGEAEDAD